MVGEPASSVAPKQPREGQRTAAKPVDLEHLARFTLGEKALEREVLELFCTQSVLYLDQLRAAMSDKDWTAAAHALKGSARAIGAWRAASAAERAEVLQGDVLVQFRASRIEELEVSLHEAQAYIASILMPR